MLRCWGRHSGPRARDRSSGLWNQWFPRLMRPMCCPSCETADVFEPFYHLLQRIWVDRGVTPHRCGNPSNRTWHPSAHNMNDLPHRVRNDGRHCWDDLMREGPNQGSVEEEDPISVTFRTSEGCCSCRAQSLHGRELRPSWMTRKRILPSVRCGFFLEREEGRNSYFCPRRC